MLAPTELGNLWLYFIVALSDACFTQTCVILSFSEHKISSAANEQVSIYNEFCFKFTCA